MRFTQLKKFLGFTLLLSTVAFGQQLNLDTQIKGSRPPSWGTDSGSANAYVLTTVAPLGPALRTGSVFMFIATHANTSASTLAVDGGSAIAIKKNVSSALASGDIPLNGVVEVFYDGTNFQCMNCGSGSPSGAAGGDLSGTYPNPTVAKINGNSVPSGAASHQILVATAPNTFSLKTVPDCTDTGGNHINYTQSTDAFSCGTSASGGGGVAISAPFANNAAGTGTNLIAEWNDAASIKTLTTADAGIGRRAPVVGICVSGCGTSGVATIQFGGTANCVFDNTTTSTISQGQVVFASASHAGNCQIRAGGTFGPNSNPETNIVVGSVHATVASITTATAYAVDLQSSPTLFYNSNSSSPLFLTATAGGMQSTASTYGLSTTSPATNASPFLTAFGPSGSNGGGFRINSSSGFMDVFYLSANGASGRDIWMDTLTNGPGAPPIAMFGMNNSSYNVPNYGIFNSTFENCTPAVICTVSGGNIWAGQTSHFRVGASTGVYVWLLAGNITIPTPENDNPGHWLAFTIKQASSGGPFTVTWPANFMHPPTMTTTAGDYTTALCMFDGTNYSCLH